MQPGRISTNLSTCIGKANQMIPGSNCRIFQAHVHIAIRDRLKRCRSQAKTEARSIPKDVSRKCPDMHPSRKNLQFPGAKCTVPNSRSLHLHSLATNNYMPLRVNLASTVRCRVPSVSKRRSALSDQKPRFEACWITSIPHVRWSVFSTGHKRYDGRNASAVSSGLLAHVTRKRFKLLQPTGEVSKTCC